MASKIRGALAALKAKIQTVTALAGDNTLAGAYSWPPDLLPFCCILPPDFVGEFKYSMGRYTRTWTVPILLVVASSTEDAWARTLDAADLLDTVLDTLEADQTLGGTCWLLICRKGTVRDSSVVLGEPGYGTALAFVDIVTSEGTGV